MNQHCLGGSFDCVTQEWRRISPLRQRRENPTSPGQLTTLSFPGVTFPADFLNPDTQCQSFVFEHCFLPVVPAPPGCSP